MSFSVSLIPGAWQWFLWPTLAAALIYGIHRFPYRVVAAEPRLLHLVLGSSVFLMLLWHLDTGLENSGFELHLFGVTAVVMLIGASPALLAAAAALALTTLVDPHLQWSGYAANFVLGSLLPVVFSAGALVLIRRMPKNNVFIYILGGGFFGSIAARLLTTLAILALFLLFGSSTSALLIETHLPWMLLVSFPEGFVNGMLISAATVYYPGWVRSFDDQRYLGN